MVKKTRKHLESYLQKQVLDWINTLPDYVVWRNYVGPIIRGNGIKCPNPMSGFPDVFGFLPCDRPFAIELKQKEGKLQENQIEWMKLLLSKNVLYIVGRELAQVQADLLSETSTKFVSGKTMLSGMFD